MSGEMGKGRGRWLTGYVRAASIFINIPLAVGARPGGAFNQLRRRPLGLAALVVPPVVFLACLVTVPRDVVVEAEFLGALETFEPGARAVLDLARLACWREAEVEGRKLRESRAESEVVVAGRCLRGGVALDILRVHRLAAVGAFHSVPSAALDGQVQPVLETVFADGRLVLATRRDPDGHLAQLLVLEACGAALGWQLEPGFFAGKVLSHVGPECEIVGCTPSQGFSRAVLARAAVQTEVDRCRSASQLALVVLVHTGEHTRGEILVQEVHRLLSADSFRIRVPGVLSLQAAEDDIATFGANVECEPAAEPKRLDLAHLPVVSVQRTRTDAVSGDHDDSVRVSDAHVLGSDRLQPSDCLAGVNGGNHLGHEGVTKGRPF